MAHAAVHLVRGRSLAAGLALVVAVLVASVAVAPSAWAGHSELDASVECVDGQPVLNWSWTAFRHQTMDPPEGTVYIQYGAPDPVGGPRDIAIGGGPLVEETHSMTGSSLLAAPAGATQVRVSVAAQWFGNTGPIAWLEASTEWLALPEPCAVEDTTVTTEAPEVEETTNTTGAVGDGSATTVTGAPPAAVQGASAARPAAAQALGVSAQAVSTQTLPDTGSSSGILAAGAVLMIAAGGALISVSRRSLHPITVSSDDPAETR